MLTTYAYDAADRLTRLSFSEGTPAKNFTYDAADRLLSAQNGADTLSWTYDVAGQLLSETSSRNGTTVAYGYDAAGRRLSVALDASPVGSYGYDAASRLVTLTSGSRVFGFSYDVSSRRIAMNAPNGIATSYAYDPLGRLTSLQAVLGGATTIAGFTYTYNATGNRTTKASPDFTEAYSYDPLDRLTAVERSGTLTGRSHFRYDSVGNRTTTQINNMVTSAVHNGLNQLLSSSAGGPLRVRGVLDEPGTARVNGQPAQMLSGNTFEATIASAPGSNSFTVEATDGSGNVRTHTYETDVPAQESSYAYDPNGNLATKTEGTDSWAYEWNAQNELTRVPKNGVEQARFAYDPFGRRVEKVAGGVTTSYTYDADDILREVHGGTTFKYVHGPGIDEPLSREDGSGALTYYHADGLGTSSSTRASREPLSTSTATTRGGISRRVRARRATHTPAGSGIPRPGSTTTELDTTIRASEDSLARTRSGLREASTSMATCRATRSDSRIRLVSSPTSWSICLRAGPRALSPVNLVGLSRLIRPRASRVCTRTPGWASVLESEELLERRSACST